VLRLSTDLSTENGSPPKRAALARRTGAAPDPGDISWRSYVPKDFNFTEFAPETLVLDVGCGIGLQLEELGQNGCRGIGIDVNPAFLATCQGQGLRVLQARAEQIPIKDGSLDGLICKGVIPFTDAPRVFGEIGRVLKAGAVGHFCYLAAGYYLRYAVRGLSWKYRLYGMRVLVNTWLYALTGRRLPGFLGDTLYQGRRRLGMYYRKHRLRVVRETPAKTFLGLPVFIHHVIQKVDH